MIGFVFGGGSVGYTAHHGKCRVRTCMVVKPATDVTGTVKQVREAVQRSLGSRLSRIEVRTPENAQFGVEKSGLVSRTELDAEAASTRELARLFVEFFKGNDLGIVVVFPDKIGVERAKKAWGEEIDLKEYRLTSFKAARKSKRSGFGGSAILEDNETVVIVAGGGPKELELVERLGQSVGKDVLIIALNLRVEPTGKDLTNVNRFRTNFETVYWYAVNPHPRWNGGILFRAYPEDWLLCRVGAFKQIKILLSSSDRPTQDEIEQAFRAEQENENDGIVGKMSSLFSPLLSPNDKKQEDKKKETK